MPLNSPVRSTRSFRIAVAVSALTGLSTAFMAWQMIERERRSGIEDLVRRSDILASRLMVPATEALPSPNDRVVSLLGPRLQGHGKLIGFALFRPDGKLAASGQEMDEFADALVPVTQRALASKEGEATEMIKRDQYTLHLFAQRLTGSDGKAVGSLVVVQDAAYLDERMAQGLLRASFWVVFVTLGLFVIIMGLSWLAYEGPLRRLTSWMQRLRMGSDSESPPKGMPLRTLFEESEHLAASFRAVRTSNWVKSQEVVKQDKVWTRDRLGAHATSCLGSSPLIIVSNREPYMNVVRDGERRVIVPASGLVTALDPILQACGGLWVAHGAGEADHDASDSRGRQSVPPENSRYTVKRVWLSHEDEEGYYYGFSNEGLWPLCHLAHERPTFRSSDWKAYQKVNRQFADAILEEVGSGTAMVWVQDYHLALLPRMLKEARPELKVGVFWHIPWPMPESFRTCPWAEPILQGLLGADLIGFHLQQYCNNFLDTVDRTVEARLDWDQFAVELQGHRSLIRPFPISVQNWSERDLPKDDSLGAQIREIQERHKIHGPHIAVGVDRIDYTKGLPERFRAISLLLEKHPEHIGKFTFIQLGAPSRTHIRRYRDLVTELESLAEEINWRYQKDGWKPIHFLASHHDASTVHAFLSMASMCIVSSLHDGMNLVAKEFVSAKTGGDGVLVLSQFAGAAHELSDAIIINPYDGEGFAEGIHAGIMMDAAERRRRMERMRRVIDENNVYAWAGNFLAELSQRKRPVTEVPANAGR